MELVEAIILSVLAASTLPVLRGIGVTVTTYLLSLRTEVKAAEVQTVLLRLVPTAMSTLTFSDPLRFDLPIGPAAQARGR